MRLNEFKVHAFVMQNTGYKHLGFRLNIRSTAQRLLLKYIIYRLLCVHEKALNVAYRTMHAEPCVVCCLGHHRVCIKET